MDDQRKHVLDHLETLIDHCEITQADSTTVKKEDLLSIFDVVYNDRLKQLFDKQTTFMNMLLDHDKLPEWPVDLTTKSGQRVIKEYVWNLVEELAEASYTLKNRTHRVTDAREIDYQHYVEELGDALAYYLEILILSGIDDEELFDEYSRKNALVKEKFVNGY